MYLHDMVLFQTGKFLDNIIKSHYNNIKYI
jgi:hypothetical protein